MITPNKNRVGVPIKAPQRKKKVLVDHLEAIVRVAQSRDKNIEDALLCVGEKLPITAFRSVNTQSGS
jgi:hypothetical protein